jgi:hypothetical protein
MLEDLISDVVRDRIRGCVRFAVRHGALLTTVQYAKLATVETDVTAVARPVHTAVGQAVAHVARVLCSMP